MEGLSYYFIMHLEKYVSAPLVEVTDIIELYRVRFGSEANEHILSKQSLNISHFRLRVLIQLSPHNVEGGRRRHVVLRY